MHVEYACVNTDNGTIEGVVLMNDKQARDANTEMFTLGKSQRWVPVIDPEDDLVQCVHEELIDETNGMRCSEIATVYDLVEEQNVCLKHLS